MVTSVHAVPFHVSPSVPPPSLPAPEEEPTAVHKAADWHDTPTRSSSEPAVPAGFGVGWMDHVVPFQASASVAASGAPEAPAARPGPPRRRAPPERRAPWMEDPTAVHAAGALHETPYRRLTMAPAGLGVASTLQVL